MTYRFDRLRVLVIDDNQHMRTLVAAVLQAFGVKMVFEAASAALMADSAPLERYLGVTGG